MYALIFINMFRNRETFCDIKKFVCESVDTSE